MVNTLLSFFNRQEQCNVLVELMREYQILKTSISSIIESTDPLVEISSVLKDYEETRRSLTKVRSNYYFIILWICLIPLSNNKTVHFINPEKKKKVS